MKNTIKNYMRTTKCDTKYGIPNQDKKRVRKPKEKTVTKTTRVKFHPAGIAILLILHFCFPEAWVLIPVEMKTFMWLFAILDFFDIHTDVKED